MWVDEMENVVEDGDDPCVDGCVEEACVDCCSVRDLLPWFSCRITLFPGGNPPEPALAALVGFGFRVRSNHKPVLHSIDAPYDR